MEIPCMPHEQHAQNFLHDDTCTPWMKLFFYCGPHPSSYGLLPLVCGIGTGMALVHKMADWQTRYTREKKMVIATSLLRCTTAQCSNMLPSTHNRRWPRFEGPAVLKMDADKKNDGFYGCGSLPNLFAAPRCTHHALRTARLGGTCNKSTTLKIRCITNV